MMLFLPHFIRPYALLGLIPVGMLGAVLLRRRTTHHAWAALCEPHLLRALLRHQTAKASRAWVTWCFIGCLSFLCLAAAGPAWQKHTVSLVSQSAPKVLLLSLSPSMHTPDLQPSRLTRALFMVQDILQHPNSPPIGLIAYTQEPFVVSPLTDDAQTIIALLPELSPDIMPVDGHDLSAALQAAETLLHQAHVTSGSILLLTDTPPEKEALALANTLANRGVSLSVLPLLPAPFITPDFQALASAGKGTLYALDTYRTWLPTAGMVTRQSPLHHTEWHDQGRWFILPALGLMLPLFQRRRTLT